MNSKSMKLMALGLAILVFALTLVLAGPVFVLLDAAQYLTNSGHAVGQEVVVIVVVALSIAFLGLCMAFVAAGRSD